MSRLYGQKHIGILLGVVLAAVVLCSFFFSPAQSQMANRADAAAIQVSEIAPRNSCIVADANGKFSDYIELFNPTDETLDLSGIGLGDGEESPRFVFENTLLQAESTLVLFGSELSFRLSAGETLVLFDRAGQPIFKQSIPQLDKNQVLYLRGKDYVVTDSPSPGFINDAQGEAAFLQSKRSDVPLGINELCADPITDPHGEWVELCNTSDTWQSYSGIYLSDAKTDLLCCLLPDFTLEAGQVRLFYLGDLTGDGFLLKSGETLYLSDAKGCLIDSVVVHALDVERTQNGQGELPFATPGYPNTQEGQTAYLDGCDFSLVISEVMANNSQYLRGPYGATQDYVELYNAGDVPLDLSEFAISDDWGDVPLAFPSITLQPQECVVFLAQKGGTRFLEGYPTLDFSISSRGETLILYHQDQPIEVLHVPRLYQDQAFGLDADMRPVILDAPGIGTW